MAYFLIFGDSTVYGAWDSEGGWAQRLRKFLDKDAIPGEKFHITYVLGISGHTTSEWLKHFEQELNSRTKEATQYGDKTVIIISLGDNDSAYLKSKKGNEVPIEEFSKNVRKLINLAKKRTKNVLWVSGNPVHKKVELTGDIAYFDKSISQYNKAAESICNEEKVMFIDVYARLKEQKNFLCSDSLHLNSNGHKIVFETVKEFLVKSKLI